jgi:hypothetical protein
LNHEKQAEYLTRGSILQLLSNDEVAKVSTAETQSRLADGDEYVDLEQLSLGVRRAPRTGGSMGSVLPRKAVHADTWSRILTKLSPPRL